MKGGAQAIAALALAKLAGPRFKMSDKLDLNSLQPACREFYFRPNQVTFSHFALNHSQVTFENTQGARFLHFHKLVYTS